MWGFRAGFVLCLILGLALPSVTVFASSEQHNIEAKQIQGYTILALDETGKKLEDKAYYEKTTISISDFNIIGDSISLKGKVSNKTFNISGNLKRADYTDTLIVGNNIQDMDENFDVIFFGIDKAPKENITINSDIFKEDQTILKLYLLEKGTRNFTILESSEAVSFIDAIQTFDAINSLNIGAYTDIFWYSKVLKPVNTQESSPITIQALTSGHSDKTYSLSYTTGVGIINEEITVRTYVEGPTSITSDGVFSTKIYPLSTRTYSTQVPGVNSNTSNFKIGVSENTVLEAYTDPGDVFRYQQWDGSWYSPGNFTIGLSWSLSIPNTGLSFSPTYTNSTQYTAKTLKNFDNSGTTKVRQTKAELSKNNRLETTSHTFDVNFSIGHYSSPGQKKLNLKWTYYVWNAQNIYSPAVGQKTSNMYFSYTSG